MIKEFSQLEKAVKRLEPVKMVVASAEDKQVLAGVKLALQNSVIYEPILVGNRPQIEKTLLNLEEDYKNYRIENVLSHFEAAQKAIKLVKDGQAQILAKGKIKSDEFLKAILDKEKGIKKYPLLSNLTLFEMSSYHKFVGITDMAIIPFPVLKEKIEIIKNSYPLWQALGINKPKVAVLAAVEVVNPAMQATVDAACLAKMSNRNQIENFIIDGPLSYDTAMDPKSAGGKGISNSSVAGDPDMLLVPNLETGNILGKSLKINSYAKSAAIVFGAEVPIMINSRSDSAERRYYSTLLARIILGDKSGSKNKNDL